MSAHLLNKEEESLWRDALVSYINRGYPCDKGSHLKFADRIIKAFRRRTDGKTIALAVLSKYQPSHMSLKAFTHITKKAVEMSSGKIRAIKYLRDNTGIGLMDAKCAVEAYVGPNPTWNP